MKIQHIANTPFNARLARGHEMRLGHALEAVEVSSDGILWHKVYKCCGETIPATVKTLEDITPTPDSKD
jgi:hypothetical protein